MKLIIEVNTLNCKCETT